MKANEIQLRSDVCGARFLVARAAAFVIATLVVVGLSGSALASDSATYTYDANGRVQTITYANGTKITYSYDTAGNRQQVVTTCSANGC